MQRIIQLIIAFAAVLMSADIAYAAGEKDFVGQMMERIESRPSAYPTSDYQQIMVSPAMMKSVVEMMASGSLEQMDMSQQDLEIFAKLLRKVKSLRIFIASSNAEAYQTLAQKTIADNKRIYKVFKSTETKKAEPSARIWTRKSGNQVVEIIAMKDADATDSKLQILNLTGEFTNDFISLLLQVSR